MDLLTDLIRNIVCDALGQDRDTLADDQEFRTLNIDSLLTLDVMVDLERKLGIHLPNNVIAEFVSVSAIVAQVRAQLVHTDWVSPAPVKNMPCPRRRRQTGGKEQASSWTQFRAKLSAVIARANQWFQRHKHFKVQKLRAHFLSLRRHRSLHHLENTMSVLKVQRLK